LVCHPSPQAEDLLNGWPNSTVYPSQVPSRRIPSTLLLPLFSLTLFTALVAIPATLSYLNLKHPSPDAGRISLHHPISPSETLLMIAASEPESFANLINGIDVPANFIELPIDRLLPSWPDTWTPGGLDVFAWRAITFPIYSLPFWWFAGFGLDAFLKRQQPRRAAMLFGVLVFSIFTFLAIGLSFVHGANDDPAVSIPILAGGILWTLLFATFPATYLRNRLGHRTHEAPPS
jgi:hypothetical protein